MLMRLSSSVLIAAVLSMPGFLAGGTIAAAEPATDAAGVPAVLPGTQPLTWTGDIASRLVDGADRFLLGEIEKSVARRPRFGIATRRPRTPIRPRSSRIARD